MNADFRRHIEARLQRARHTLATQVVAGGKFGELQDAAEEVELLEKIRKKERRLLDLAALLTIVSLLACIMGLSSLVRANRAATMVSANLSGLTLTNNPVDEKSLRAPFLRNIDVSELLVESDTSTKLCLQAETPQPSCTQAERISVLSLQSTARVRIRIRGTPGCVEMSWLDGTSEFAYASVPRNGPPTNIVLKPKDRIRLCSDAPWRAIFPSVSNVVLGEQVIDTQEWLSTLRDGTLSFPSFGRVLPLANADVVDASFDAQRGLLVLEQAAPLSISLVGIADKAVTRLNQSESNVLPRWLDLIRNAPALHGAISIIAGLLAFVWALRQKLLSF